MKLIIQTQPIRSLVLDKQWVRLPARVDMVEVIGLMGTMIMTNGLGIRVNRYKKISTL